MQTSRPRGRLPLSPRKRTSDRSFGMSAKCQNRTLPPHSITSSAPFDTLGRPLQALIDLMAQEAEVDRLGKQSSCPKLGRSLGGRLVPIGGNHDDGNVWTIRLHHRKHFKAGHTRHVDIREDQDKRGIRNRLYLLQSGRRGERKLHHKATRSKIPTEMLPKHAFDIRFVVNDNNVRAQCVLRCPAVARGNVIMNSVNEPGSVSTWIVPPCFTTMSWLIDRPRPVPSPGGLVVKHGSNILSLTSDGMPVPLSRIRISTRSDNPLVVACNVGSKPSLASFARLVAA